MISDELIERDAADLVSGTLNHFIELRNKAGLPTKWRDYEKEYHNGTDDYYNGKAKVRIPILHTSVERVVPKFDKTIFPPDGDFLAAVPGNLDNDFLVEDAEKVVKLIKRQFTKAKARTKLISSYRSLCIYGTVFFKYYWDYSIKERYVRKKNTQGVWERVPEEDIVSDGPTFDVLDIWDIYADPKDENLEGAVVQEIVQDYSKLYQKRWRKEDDEEIGVYRNVEQLKDSKLTAELDSNRQESDRIRGLGERTYGPHEHKVRTYEYWGPMPKYLLTKKEEDKEDCELVEGYIVVGMKSIKDTSGAVFSAEDMVVLRVTPNPFDHQEKPFLRGCYLKLDGQLYGMSMFEVNMSLAMELNTLRCQLMDMRTFMLKTKWIKDRNSEISNTSLKDINNQVIETNDVNGIKPVVPPDFSGSALASEGTIKQDLEDGTGATKFLGGTPLQSSIERTAEGVSSMLNAGLERFELVVTQFEEDVLKKLGEGFWWLNNQFMEDEVEFAMVGGKTIKFHPRQIDYVYDLQFLGIRELGEKAFKINALNILIQNVTPFAQYGLDPIPVLLRLVKLLGLGDIIPEIDKRPASQLEFSPEGEKQLLLTGQPVKIDLNDNHDAYIQMYLELLNQPSLPDNIRQNTMSALGQRQIAKDMLDQLRATSTSEPTENENESGNS